jgi:hypothetical protein
LGDAHAPFAYFRPGLHLDDATDARGYQLTLPDFMGGRGIRQVNCCATVTEQKRLLWGGQVPRNSHPYSADSLNRQKGDHNIDIVGSGGCDADTFADSKRSEKRGGGVHLIIELLKTDPPMTPD